MFHLTLQMSNINFTMLLLHREIWSGLLGHLGFGPYQATSPQQIKGISPAFSAAPLSIPAIDILVITTISKIFIWCIKWKERTSGGGRKNSPGEVIVLAKSGFISNHGPKLRNAWLEAPVKTTLKISSSFQSIKAGFLVCKGF